MKVMALIVLVVGGLLVVGILVAIIALLSNPNTRVVGIVLLAVVVMAVLLIGVVAFFYMFNAPMPAAIEYEQVGRLLYQTG